MVAENHNHGANFVEFIEKVGGKLEKFSGE